MIELKGINKSFDLDTFALNNVSLTFPNIGLISIIGKSGSGKSTLLNIIGGIVSPSKGEVFYDNTNSNTFTTDEYNSLRNNYLGFIFQEFHLLNQLTVYDNIKLSLDLQQYPSEEVDNIIISSLKKLEIEHLSNKYIDDISSGEKQRVAICRIIAKGCRVILADEPTGSLDEITAESVLKILKSLSKEILVILVTHDKDNANRYSDRIIELSLGKVKSDITISKSNIDNNINELDLTKKKLGLNNIFKLTKKVLRKNKKKFVFATILWFISISFLLINLNFLFINNVRLSTNAIYENQIHHYKIVKKTFFNNGEIESIDLDEFIHFDNIILNEYYYTGYNYGINSFQPTLYETDPILESFYKDRYVFNYIEIGNQFNLSGVENIVLSNSDILITDFIASFLIYRNIIDVDSLYECIGKQIKIDSKVFLIKGVVKTDYLDYLTDDYLKYENESFGFENDNSF